MLLRVVGLLTHAARISWELACRKRKCVLSIPRDEALPSLSCDHTPYHLSPFVGWPIPASLLLIYNWQSSKYLSILSRAWVLKLRSERFVRGCKYSSDILLKSIKYIVLSFVNLL